MVPRQILNKDRGRERCTVKDLDASRLKRVAFRVDVEIAGPPRFIPDDEEEVPDSKKKKPKDNKMKEKGEGEALKHPSVVKHEKETTGRIKASGEVVGKDAGSAEPQTTAANNFTEGRRLIPTRLQIGKSKAAAQASPQDSMFHKSEELDDLYGVAAKPKSGPVGSPLNASSGPRKTSHDALFEGDGLDGLYGVASRPAATAKPSASKPARTSFSHEDDFSDHEHGLDTFYGGTVKKVRSNSASTQPKPAAPLRAADDEAWGGDVLDDLFGVPAKTPKKKVPSPMVSPRLQDVARKVEQREYFDPGSARPGRSLSPQGVRAQVQAQQPASAAPTQTIQPVGNVQNAQIQQNNPADTPSAPPRVQDRPTTDPLRMYRRCCQLREAPVLKRISEQLGAAKTYGPDTPGLVNCLDLTGSRMQLADMVCLGDWLAISPVKRLLLEDANLTDEGLRVILAGLLATKQPEHGRKRGRSSPTRLREVAERVAPGAVERLSLKNNPKITREGWKYICGFINMSRTIKAIDVSLNPFTASPPPQTAASQADKKSSTGAAPAELVEILYKSIVNRSRGPPLEELYMSECNLTTDHVRRIADAATVSGLSRLGLAGNHFGKDAIEYIASYVQSGICKALDIGGNNLRHALGPLAAALHRESPLWALSVANCNLEASDLLPLFSGLIGLPDFRFIDLSHNHDLFSHQSSALASIRKYLPQLTRLRRIHLLDVNMSPADAIGLAEVMPECRNLNHVNILENPQLRALASANDDASQEETCALYASMMTACRISKTLICVDMDIPTPGISDVNSALAKQIIAYCLRNLERISSIEAFTLQDPASAILADVTPTEDIEVPDVLLHIVGLIGGDSGAHDHTAAAPDNDYIVGSVGVVKALSYLIGQRTSDLRRQSRTLTGAQSPNPMVDPATGQARVKDMSKTLLSSARKIRTRLQPSLEREAYQGDDLARRMYCVYPFCFHLLTSNHPPGRLIWLDQMLNGMIGRFEQEFPETRLAQPAASIITPLDQEPIDISTSPARSRASSNLSTTAGLSPTELASSLSSLTTTSLPAATAYEPAPTSPLHASSRRASGTSLHARALGNEEASFLRLGQRFRRELMPPRGTQDYLHGTSTHDPPEAEHLAALRARLEELGGDVLRERVLLLGLEGALREWADGADGLRRLEQTDPHEFRRFREMQVRAQMLTEGHEGGGEGLLMRVGAKKEDARYAS